MTPSSRTSSLVCLAMLLGLSGCGTSSELPIDADALSSVDTAERAIAPNVPAHHSDHAQAIVLGDISDKPVKVVDRFQPLADYLAANLDEHGIEIGLVKVAPDMATMKTWIAAGEVDLYFDSPYPALEVSQATGATPILRRWKKGVSEYHSVFFTLVDSGITSLEDLAGTVVSFDSPYSTSGYMMPVVALADANLKPVHHDSPGASGPVAAQNEVGYVFSDDDDNTLLWVLEGDVVAGVVDNETFSKLAAEGQENIRIIHETESVPRHMAVAAPDLDAELAADLKDVLMAMDDSTAGQSVLEAFERTTRFDEFPSPDVLDRLNIVFDQANELR